MAAIGVYQCQRKRCNRSPDAINAARTTTGPRSTVYLTAAETDTALPPPTWLYNHSQSPLKFYLQPHCVLIRNSSSTTLRWWLIIDRTKALTWTLMTKRFYADISTGILFPTKLDERLQWQAPAAATDSWKTFARRPHPTAPVGLLYALYLGICSSEVTMFTFTRQKLWNCMRTVSAAAFHTEIDRGASTKHCIT